MTSNRPRRNRTVLRLVALASIALVTLAPAVAADHSPNDCNGLVDKNCYYSPGSGIPPSQFCGLWTVAGCIVGSPVPSQNQ
jgi:hypothetical protein